LRGNGNPFEHAGETPALPGEHAGKTPALPGWKIGLRKVLYSGGSQTYNLTTKLLEELIIG
jgi:hypothetical protein